MEKEGLTAARLAKLAERAASFEEALESQAEAAFAAVCVEGRTDGLVLDMERLLRREPREVALRLLLRAVQAAGRGERSAPIRLERAETLLKALAEAFSARKPLKRTLGGALLAYDGAERLSLRREAARRRGGKRAMVASEPALPAQVRDATPANQSNSIALSALV